MPALNRLSMSSVLLSAALLVLGGSEASAQTSVYKALSGKCRVANSFGGAGPLAAGVDRNINVTNTASYAAQGGTGNTSLGNSSTGCGIPASVTALVISTSVVPRGTAGTLKVFEAGKAAADGNTVAFNAVDAVTNDMIVPTRTTDTTAEITINSSKATDYILDVVGYFIPTPKSLVAYQGGNASTNLVQSAPVVLRSVTLVPPGPGFVVAVANTNIIWDTPSAGAEVACSVDTTTSGNGSFNQYAKASKVAGLESDADSIGTVRHFQVTAAGAFTAHLVCTQLGLAGGAVSLYPQLSLTFVPD